MSDIQQDSVTADAVPQRRRRVRNNGDGEEAPRRRRQGGRRQPTEESAAAAAAPAAAPAAAEAAQQSLKELWNSSVRELKRRARTAEEKAELSALAQKLVEQLSTCAYHRGIS